MIKKKIIIGKGVKHFKKESGLKWYQIRARLNYDSTQSARNLITKKQGSTALIEKLCDVFSISPSEFIKQCEVEVKVNNE